MASQYNQQKEISTISPKTRYPEPPPTIQKPLIPKKNENIYELQNKDICLEIRKYQNNAWEIEVRYDKVDSSFVRQPYTGRQEILPLSCPQLEIKKNILQFHDEKQMLSFNLFNGDIHLFFENMLVFNTITPSFSWHKTEQSIFENLMSLKVTDFSQRAPFAPRGQMFSTHMIRFRYKRPKGIVLGLPGQAGELNRNGYRFELSNTDTFKHTPDRPPLYQSWPILFHEGEQDGWIAIFHDNPSRTFVDVGEFYKDSVTFESISGNTRIFLIAGETLDVVSQKLCRLLGTNDHLPLWAFGYHQCRFSYESTDELRSVIKNMREHDFPLDAVYCDIDAMDEFRVFTHNKQTFGDIHQFTQEAKDQGVQTISIVDPGVKVDSSYKIYKELIDIEGYLKNPDGTPFVATVWPGDSLFPDFFSEDVQTWWAKKQYEWLRSAGYAGVWNDMNEPSNFRGMWQANTHAQTSKGTFKHVYNLYGYMMAKASHKGMKMSYPNNRPFVITRSGYPGIQQFAITWHGDNHAWWEHLRLAFHTLAVYSLCGSLFTGADVPGFTGNPPDDLAIRFFQLGAWMPFFRGHSIYFCENKEPYAYKKETQKLIRQAIHLRYSLLREWYTAFYRAIILQQSPVSFCFTGDGCIVPDQLLYFDKFLVAPIFHRDQCQRLIYLPEGLWYEFGNPHKSFNGNQWICLPVGLETLPVFVKAGSIVTINTVKKNSYDTLRAQEHYIAYPDSQGHAKGFWYDDDGISLEEGTIYELRLVNNKVVKNPLAKPHQSFRE